jgi:hypothetical protein
MVRFEKFLQFRNGHDVATNGGASDARLRSRRVWRSLYATPLIVFSCLYHNRVLDQLVLMSITPWFMKIFRSRFSRSCTGTVANVSQNYNSLGWWFRGKMGVRKKNFSKKKIFFPQLFCIFLNNISYDTKRLRRQPKHGGPSSYRFRVMGGSKIFAKKILTPVSENLVDRFW